MPAYDTREDCPLCGGTKDDCELCGFVNNSLKFTMTFKTPDVVDRVLSDIKITAREELYEKAEQLVQQYVENGEYITVEFDTGKGACSVVKVWEPSNT